MMKSSNRFLIITTLLATYTKRHNVQSARQSVCRLQFFFAGNIRVHFWRLWLWLWFLRRRRNFPPPEFTCDVRLYDFLWLLFLRCRPSWCLVSYSKLDLLNWWMKYCKEIISVELVAVGMMDAMDVRMGVMGVVLRILLRQIMIL